MHIHAHYNMVNNNTFHFSVVARYFIEMRHASGIAALRRDPIISSLPWRIVGAGSNLLLTHDLDEVIIRCTYDEIKIVKEDNDFVWLSVGAGHNWHSLVRYTVEKGWWGLENLALIPGTVGAAPVQNIGAYGAEAQDTITRIQCFDLRTGKRIEMRNSECAFSYRSSIFKTTLVDRILVHRVTFRLRKKGNANLIYDPLRDAFEAVDTHHLTPMDVYRKIIEIRNSKIPDPSRLGHAGSFFQNPTVQLDHFHKLQQLWADIPGHKTLDGNIKIPAAWLIEKAGWKGKRIGDAGVFEHHALILANYGNATGNDILALADAIRQDVVRIFGISLEQEVVTL